eukprot:2597556-Amphidinium_carterae.1
MDRLCAWLSQRALGQELESNMCNKTNDHAYETTDSHTMLLLMMMMMMMMMMLMAIVLMMMQMTMKMRQQT